MTANYITIILFVPVTLLIGVLTTQGDFLYKKINNKVILAGILYACTIYFILASVSLLYLYCNVKIFATDYSVYLTNTLDRWSINLILTTFVAYFIWRFKMWGAGDAKLFICYSALLPINQYPFNYFKGYFQSFFLLLAIFLPALFIVITKSLSYLIRNNIKRSKRQYEIGRLIEVFLTKDKIKKGLKLLFGVFAIFFIARIPSFCLHNRAFWFNSPFLLFLPILLFKYISKILMKNFNLIMSIFIITFVIYYMQSGFSWRIVILQMLVYLKFSCITLIAFPLCNRLIEFYTKKKEEVHIAFALWMFLGVVITWGIKVLVH